MFCVFSQIFKNAITLLEEEMNKDSILDLIKTGEGITLEFKTNISSNLGKEICAFANTQGGKILLGVGDSGNIIGIKTKEGRGSVHYGLIWEIPVKR